MDDKDVTEIVHEGRVTRRRMLFGTAGAIGAAAFLAACGDDDDSGRRRRRPPATTAAGAATTTGGGAATTTAAARPPSGGGGGGGDLAALLGIEEASAGKGKTIELGAVLALTGTGSFYGKTMSRGLDLGGQAHRRARRPDVQVHLPRPQVGRRRRRRAGDGRDRLQGHPGQVRLLRRRPRGDAVVDGREQGVHARRRRRHEHLRPGQAVLLGHPGDHAERPDAGPVQVDEGDLPGRQDGRHRRLGHRRDEQRDHQGGHPRRRSPTAATSSTTSTSWCRSAARTSPRCCRRSRPTSPTSCWSCIYGQDPGSFANQAATAGLKAIRIGFEFTPDGVNASKGTYDSDGYTFAYDYFDPKNPKSPLAKKFVEDFNADNGEDPDFYAANFYENAFVMWELMRRIWKDDPDAEITGEALDEALQENLTVVSVYGGDDIDARHATPSTRRRTPCIKREMGVFEYKGGDGHPEGVLRHRRRRLPTGLTATTATHWKEPSTMLAVTFETFRQLTVDGFFRGCSYGLLGVGFALILGVTGRFHFAYGFTYTLAAYLAFTFTFRRGSGRSGRSAILGILLAGLVGAGIERGVYRPLARNAGATALLAVFVAALGIGIAGENLIRHHFGRQHAGLLRAAQDGPRDLGRHLHQLRLVAGGERASPSRWPSPRCCATRASAARSRRPGSTPTSPRRSASTPTAST